MVRARQEQAWGTPSVLWGILTVIKAHPEQASTFVQFLKSIPAPHLQPDIVPALGDKDWAQDVLKGWQQYNNTPEPVKNAIRALQIQEEE